MTWGRWAQWVLVLSAGAALLAGCSRQRDTLEPLIALTAPETSANLPLRAVAAVRGFVLDNQPVALVEVKVVSESGESAWIPVVPPLPDDLTSVPEGWSLPPEERTRLTAFAVPPQWFPARLSFREGPNEIRVRVTGANGRSAVRQFLVRIDTTPPTLELRPPRAKTVQAGTRTIQVMEFSGAVSDSSNVVSVRVLAPDGSDRNLNIACLPCPQAEFADAVPLGRATVVAQDAAGNEARVDITPPR
ncbi:MAG: hypothetical protein HY335_01580 [Deinococcus sp.]|nr:hypothetical protein [Deinococcus sp.]